MFDQWLPVAALVAVFLTDLFRSDTPPSWLRLSKQSRLAIAAVFAAVSCSILAHVDHGLGWPAAVMNGLGAAGAAWLGINVTTQSVPAPSGDPTAAPLTQTLPTGSPAPPAPVSTSRQA